MSQKELEQLIKAYEARKRSEILMLINRINRLFGKSFKDVHSLMKAARLINKRSLDPLTKSRIEKIVDELYSKITDETERVVLNAGKLSARFQYSIERDLFKRLKVPSLVSFRNGSAAAVKTVLNEKSFGLKFSGRIWKQHKNYRKRIENVMVDGLKNGYSAKSIAKDLVNAEYKNTSGPGVYKDPRKNAERLTRSTINQAYQRSDHERWKDAWHIKCIEVRLSNAHPRYDICDVLQGRYPKDFLFPSWHPQCLCTAVPILVSEKERDLYEDYVLGLRDVPPKIRYVTKTPAGFDMWMEKNKERVAGWKNEPEWITANQQYIKK